MALTSPSPAEIRALRERLGVSQAFLAYLLGVPAKTVGRWEDGRKAAPPMLRLALAALEARLGRPVAPRAPDGPGLSRRPPPEVCSTPETARQLAFAAD